MDGWTVEPAFSKFGSYKDYRCPCGSLHTEMQIWRVMHNASPICEGCKQPLPLWVMLSARTAYRLVKRLAEPVITKERYKCS